MDVRRDKLHRFPILMVMPSMAGRRFISELRASSQAVGFAEICFTALEAITQSRTIDPHAAKSQDSPYGCSSPACRLALRRSPGRRTGDRPFRPPRATCPGWAQCAMLLPKWLADINLGSNLSSQDRVAFAWRLPLPEQSLIPAAVVFK